MAYVKQGFEDGQILTADQLNHIEDGIEDVGETGGTGGLPLPPTAEVGQYIRVAAVDDNGKVTATEAANIEAESLPVEGVEF